MDNSFMVALSTQQLLRQRMDVTANNLANLTTTGFKVESIVARPLTERPAQATDKPSDVTFADGWQLQRDMAPGPMQPTGNPLDVALESSGFFTVKSGDDELFTRDGGFSLDEQGRLVTRAGLPVQGEPQREGVTLLDEADADIVVDPANGPVTIARNGAVMQGGAQVAQLKIVDFDTPAALEKRGGNLWAPTDEEPRAPAEIRVAQGFLESSNVVAIRELTNMIETSRAYQSVAKLISDSDNLREQAISKLARVR